MNNVRGDIFGGDTVHYDNVIEIPSPQKKDLCTEETVHYDNIIEIPSPQKKDLCTEELRDRTQVMKLPGHWTRSVYHLEEL